MWESADIARGPRSDLHARARQRPWAGRGTTRGSHAPAGGFQDGGNDRPGAAGPAAEIPGAHTTPTPATSEATPTPTVATPTTVTPTTTTYSTATRLTSERAHPVPSPPTTPSWARCSDGRHQSSKHANWCPHSMRQQPVCMPPACEGRAGLKRPVHVPGGGVYGAVHARGPLCAPCAYCPRPGGSDGGVCAQSGPL